MRILIALTYYRPHYSGLTIHAEREARALAALGHQVTVLTSRFSKNLPFREVQDGVEIIRPRVWFHISKGVIMPSMPFWAWKILHRVDVVHLHAPQLDAAPIAVLSRTLGKPVLLTYHCDLRLPQGIIHTLANKVSNFANHISAKAAHVIVHNTLDYAEHSPFLRNYLKKVFPILPPVEVVPVNQADRDAFRTKFQIEPGQILIGMAARLATEKGVEYLAEALPIVLLKHPDAHVLFVGPHQNVVGEETYTRQLAPLLEQLGKHWSFLGLVSPVEMSAFFHECHVTVLPSINSTESYGLVQVESMACGTPVVASDLPGVRVPVRLSGAGLVVPAKNSQALADAINAILDNPEAYTGNPETVVAASAPLVVAAEYLSAFNIAIERSRKRAEHLDESESGLVKNDAR